METPLTPNDIALNIVTVTGEQPIEVGNPIPEMGTTVIPADTSVQMFNTDRKALIQPVGGTSPLDGAIVLPKE